MDLPGPRAVRTLEGMKGYGQFCPVAKAAEIVAERWTPLVLRELVCGSHRFSHLHRSLPLMSRTLLAQRLALDVPIGLAVPLLQRGHRMHGFLRTMLPVALTVICLPAGLSAGSKPVPTRLAQAQYVALGYDLGDRFLSDSEAIADPDVLPEDRKALAKIRDQIEKWNRYVITPRLAHAELFIAVRRGRRASGTSRVPVGGPGPASGTTTRSLQAELSSPNDMLSVYESGGGMPGTLLWREQRPGGLSSSSPSLFEDFQSAVESLSKQP